MGQLRRLKKQTRDLLEGLGPDADAVAERLRAFGVHGVPADNHSCAVARFTAAQLGTEPSIRSVAVGPCSMTISLQRDDGRPHGRLFVQLPKAVRHFIAAFDDSTYPDLFALPSWVEPVSCSAADETPTGQSEIDEVGREDLVHAGIASVGHHPDVTQALPHD